MVFEFLPFSHYAYIYATISWKSTSMQIKSTLLTSDTFDMPLSEPENNYMLLSLLLLYLLLISSKKWTEAMRDNKKQIK